MINQIDKYRIQLLAGITFFIFPLFVPALNGQFYIQKYLERNYMRMVDVQDMDDDGKYEVLTDNEIDFFITKNEGNHFRTTSLLPHLNGEDLPYVILNNEELVAIGDMNGDNKKDIVVPGGNGSLLLYLQQANGDFNKSEIATNVGNSARPLLADMDQDGDLDIVIFYPLHLKILLNLDGSIYEQGADHPTISQDLIHYVEDLNGDGVNEIILMTIYSPNNEFWVKIYKYDLPSQSLQLINQNLKIQAFGQPRLQFNDLDSDGDLDILASWFSVYNLTEIIHDGDYGFNINTTNIKPGQFYPVLTDINQDGKTDFILRRPSNILIFGKNELGIYDTLANLNYPYSVPIQPLSKLVDYDLDGDLDLISENVLFKNNNQWSTAETVLLIPQSYLDFQVIDLDKDGDMDILSGAKQGLHYLEQMGPWDFDLISIPIPTCLTLSKLIPLEYDQDADVEFIGQQSDSVFLINKIGDWEYEKTFLFRSTLPNLAQLIPADLDADGDLDIVHRGKNLAITLEWYENLGGNIFEAHALFGSLWWTNDAEVLDFDADGDLDIISSVLKDIGGKSYGQIHFYKNDGSGNFVVQILASERDIEYYQFYLGDIDQDNDMDILADVNNKGSYQSRVFVQLRDSTFFPKFFNDNDIGTIGSLPSIIPGQTIYLTSSGTKLAWYTVDPFLQQELHVIPGEAKYPRYIRPADFDNDGDLDFFIEAETKAPVSGHLLHYLIYETVSSDSIPLLSVHVFLDKNKNGLKDIEDENFGFHTITLTPENLIYFSNDSVHYYQLESGNHSVTIGGYNKDLWEITTGEETQNFIVDEDNLHHIVEFGLYPKLFQYNIDIDLTIGNVFCARNAPHFLQMKNTGTLTIDMSETQFSYDQLLTPIQIFPDPSLVVPGKITHDWPTWYVNDSHTATYALLAPDETHTGEKYTATVEATLIDSVGIPVSFFDTITYRLLCSFDPNSMEVNPHIGDNGYILNTPTLLEYTVHFQNFGNKEAENVRIECSLSEHLEKNSLKIISSSHPEKMHAVFDQEQEIFIIDFINIQLPDTSIGWPESQGFLKFSALTQSGLPIETIIEGSAKIYFDFNQPVPTNTIHNEVTNCSQLNQLTISVDSLSQQTTYTLEVVNPILDSISWVIDQNQKLDSSLIHIVLPEGEVKTLHLKSYSPLCILDTLIILGTTKSKPEIQENQVTIYPTLSSEELHLRFDEKNLKIISYKIFDATSVQVGEEKAFNSTTIPVNHLPLGAYFLQLFYSNDLSTLHRFIRL